MADNAFGDFFMSDADDELLEDDDEIITAPVVVPTASPAPVAPTGVSAVAPTAVPGYPAVAAPVVPAAASAPVAPAVQPTAPRPATPAVAYPGDMQPSREERLAAALNKLMNESREVQASALVSLDGFTMASALPEGMQEDRVGAMSAAILGLGERAAVELGRGSLSQVIIEGNGGYVVLMAAGQRAALTCLADAEAKLGLVLYDMRSAADTIAAILG